METVTCGELETEAMQPSLLKNSSKSYITSTPMANGKGNGKDKCVVDRRDKSDYKPDIYKLQILVDDDMI